MMMFDSASLAYEKEHIFPYHLFGEKIEVVSKPGLAEWDRLPPSTELLAEYPIIHPDDSVLVIGCHHGALGVYLARHLADGFLSLMDNNFIALEMTRKTLDINQSNSNVKILPCVELPRSEHQRYDAAFVQLPKGRGLSRRWLLQAHYALKNNGRLFIAGAKTSGIRATIKDAKDLFGNANILGYKKGNRIAQIIKDSRFKAEPDWVSVPGIAMGTWYEFSISVQSQCFKIRSLPGVFSFDHLDDGTAMLLNAIKIQPGNKILDVGCGYGIIGLFAAVHQAGWIDLVDNNLLAIASCQENLSLNQITTASAISGDLIHPIREKRYDLILSNPPFHAGQSVDYQIAEAMIKQSYHSLEDEGQLVIVANRFLPYNRLISDVFGNVHTLAESGKFQVISGKKSV